MSAPPDLDAVRYSIAGNADKSDVPPPRRAGPRSRKTVFVSYAREDGARAQRIVSGLRARGWEVSIDQDFLRPGTTWTQDIADHISRCAVVVAVVTPAAAGSQWVNKELIAAINGNRPVLPIVIDSTFVEVARGRFALLGDAHWLVLEHEQLFDQLRLDEVSNHLEQLAARSRPAKKSSSEFRLGTALMWIGIIGLVATFGWFAAGLVGAGGLLLDFIDAGNGTSGSDPFAAFRQYMESLTGLYVAFPVAFASVVLIVTGWSMRRRARKRLLVGRVRNP